ncbi:MAG: hypothetical protein CMC21_02105 [Flavobacteriaceae bacterium]|nr:hypothetical protein [Flavobacteriaceae bacterium]|tara:strand:+ start:2882 stop:3256 length:375 start_codon:yes stop_codon:yes gene_type:complete
MYKEKVEYLNDIEAGKRKIKDWLRTELFTRGVKVQMGGCIDTLSNCWITVNKKTIFSYLDSLQSQYNLYKDYEWVDWVDSRLELNLTDNHLIFVSHKFEVERVEHKEDNNPCNQIDEDFEREEE